MGEAKLKEERRRQHATKIVDAFETYIKSIGKAYELQARFDLIETLITPPPKD